jgi:hypothetical protein
VRLAVLAAGALVWVGVIRGEAKEKGPRLEFRILANKQDEPKALEAASKYLAAASKDAKRKTELEERAKAGLPPPVPKVRRRRLREPRARRSHLRIG